MRRSSVGRLFRAVLAVATLVTHADAVLAATHLERRSAELATAAPLPETLAVPSVRGGARLPTAEHARSPVTARVEDGAVSCAASVATLRVPIPRARSCATRGRIRASRDDPFPH